MEVRFKPDLEAKLSRMAAEQCRTAETLVEEAVERLVEFETPYDISVRHKRAALPWQSTTAPVTKITSQQILPNARVYVTNFSL